MIKITVIDQMDSIVEEYEMRFFNIGQIQETLTILDYKYNTGTGYWEKGDKYVLLQEVEE